MHARTLKLAMVAGLTLGALGLSAWKGQDLEPVNSSEASMVLVSSEEEPYAKPTKPSAKKPASDPHGDAHGSKPTKDSGLGHAPPKASQAHAAEDDHAAPSPDELVKSLRKAPKPADAEADESAPHGSMKPATREIAANDEPTGTVDSASALERLKAGNLRWVEDQTTHPRSDAKRRKQAAGGQKPFAAVLTCADSRLPVERVFDQGVGDVFVVRVAGNVAGTSETGTMEYGAEHLHVPLLVVMGHSKCGAVAAAAGEGLPEGALGELVSQVKPSVERARKLNPSAEADEIVSEAIKENVWQTVFTLLKTSPVLSEKVRSGKLMLVGAVCDVASGKVEWLGEHPWQAELCEAFAQRRVVENKAESKVDAHAEVDEAH
jgi:carbonic anhydrase